jgi:hypothetical protein
LSVVSSARATRSIAKPIVAIANGQVEDRIDDGKNPAPVDLGRQCGLKSGKARSARLPVEERQLRIWRDCA